MFRKRVVLLLVFVLFVVTTVVSTVETGFSKEIKPTTVTLWCMAFDPHVNGFDNVISEFQKQYPQIKVMLEPQPGQAEMVSKMRAALAAGKGPHGFTTPGTTITEWVVAGGLQPVSPNVVTTDFVKKEMFPENYVQCNLEGQIWAIGIPDPPGDAGIIVNADDFKTAGLELVDRFDSKEQLLEYAKKLARYDETGRLVHGGLSFQESNNPMYFYSWIVDNGGRFWDNDTQKFTLKTPEAKEVLQWFYDLFYTHKVDSIELPDSLSALVQNLTSMAFMWPEFLPFAKETYPELNFVFVMKPPFRVGNAPVINHTDTWNVVVPKYVSGDEQEAMFEFLRFLISEEGQLLFLEANPGFSPLKSLVFNHDYYKTGKGAYLIPVIEAVKAGQYRYWGPFVDADIMLYDILWPNMDALIHGQIAVDECLAKMEQELNEQNARTRSKYPQAPTTTIYYEGFPLELAPYPY